MKLLVTVLALMMLMAPHVRAAPADGIADALVEAVRKPAITADTLPADLGRLTRFVRHDGNGVVLFTNGDATDGYVRHAYASFDTLGSARKNGDKIPLFSVAIEFVEQPDFTFENLASTLEQRLGTPSISSNQSGATFRTWLLKGLPGRSLQIARTQGSDNGDPVTIVYIIQNR